MRSGKIPAFRGCGYTFSTQQKNAGSLRFAALRSRWQSGGRARSRRHPEARGDSGRGAL